jgi:hypothetical protein
MLLLLLLLLLPAPLLQLLFLSVPIPTPVLSSYFPVLSSECCALLTLFFNLHLILNILWRTDPLLGKDVETNEKTTVAMQRSGKDAYTTIDLLLETLFSTRYVQKGYKADNWGDLVSYGRLWRKVSETHPEKRRLGCWWEMAASLGVSHFCKGGWEEMAL